MKRKEIGLQICLVNAFTVKKLLILVFLQKQCFNLVIVKVAGEIVLKRYADFKAIISHSDQVLEMKKVGKKAKGKSTLPRIKCFFITKEEVVGDIQKAALQFI